MKPYSPLYHEQAVETVFSASNLPLSSLLFGEGRALAQHSLDIPVRFVLLPVEGKPLKHGLDGIRAEKLLLSPHQLLVEEINLFSTNWAFGLITSGQPQEGTGVTKGTGFVLSTT